MASVCMARRTQWLAITRSSGSGRDKWTRRKWHFGVEHAGRQSSRQRHPVGRDGIFAIASKTNLFKGNHFRDLRFAVRYMYTDDSEVSDNVSTNDTVGFAIMYSHRLTVRGNISDSNRDRGLLFNFANGSEISGNVVQGRLQSRLAGLSGGCAARNRKSTVCPRPKKIEPLTPASGARIGPEKCVFIYNANNCHNIDCESCEIGVHLAAGSEGNEIAGNTYFNNRNQVKYVGTRDLNSSVRNLATASCWSDNPSFDLNGDGNH